MSDTRFVIDDSSLRLIAQDDSAAAPLFEDFALLLQECRLDGHGIEVCNEHLYEIECLPGRAFHEALFQEGVERDARQLLMRELQHCESLDLSYPHLASV